MTLQQLRYVASIVEAGSFNEAARNLYVAQPTLSGAIKELERELGIHIFNRTSRGATLTDEGAEFLSYARQVLEQADLLERHYLGTPPQPQLCAISTQHYAFAVEAFVALIRETGADRYKFTLRETRTHDIIEDVASLRSEAGILFENDFNRSVLRQCMDEHHLEFHPLFEAEPHVFLSHEHPLADRDSIRLPDLDPYPRLAYEQGDDNSFFFSEEILSTVEHARSIYVSDRATLFNLLIGLNGYTLCTGVLNSDLNGDDIVAVPLVSDERMLLGYVTNRRASLSAMAQRYLAKLREILSADGFELLS
ncbi:MAG: LysR family transcriptional regulator [Atopobiaceae bacterium]|nr:LysR family transcriptional regulator [Atopobiaceae bacterium]MCH4181162.1 LysR family transcriptional regulator [Atopobiaceae bacterium]MCH4214820.1 LysR family transcriptional regulator [Atopobiaceae bacterium]MCH4230240.1 LysR family transcriptional regulator [Atopobiaceae bacterium]MCH4276792.1 LysR family transcriptional regulator [Atopobiaceae bacterium]